ncbi:hypothetical protein [Sphingobacterium sp. SYP-B4668]|uniref:hypothetical protein n=1 Tax=Sphingobacterium sp. SYP-B4668 TaxID=2996035 RepID=UPI0022DDCED7|nr:hypothetical protein [Sphingobacterium sp. SYP-B4668]
MEQRPTARFIDFDNGESIAHSLRTIYAKEIVHDIGKGKINELYQFAKKALLTDKAEYYCSQYHISMLYNYEKDQIYAKGIRSLKDSIDDIWYKIALTAQKIGFENLKILKELACQDQLYILRTTSNQGLYSYLMKESAEQMIVDQLSTPYTRLPHIVRTIIQIGYDHQIHGIEQLENALIRKSKPYIIKFYTKISPETALAAIKIGLQYLLNYIQDPNENQRLIKSTNVLLDTDKSMVMPSKICYVKKI